MDLLQLLPEPELLSKLSELQRCVLLVEAMDLHREIFVGVEDVAVFVGALGHALGQSALLLNFTSTPLSASSRSSVCTPPSRLCARLCEPSLTLAGNRAMAQNAVPEGLLDLDEVLSSEGVVVGGLECSLVPWTW